MLDEFMKRTSHQPGNGGKKLKFDSFKQHQSKQKALCKKSFMYSSSVAYIAKFYIAFFFFLFYVITNACFMFSETYLCVDY